MWTLGRLVAADGTLVVYGDLVYPLGDRFIPDIALVRAGGQRTILSTGYSGVSVD